MKFENTLKSRATIKKKKEYDFPEFSEDELNSAKSYTFEKPLIVRKDDGCIYEMYNDDGRLAIVMFHSWDKFKEIK